MLERVPEDMELPTAPRRMPWAPRIHTKEPDGRASETFFAMPAFQAEYRRRQEAVRQGGRSAERRALRAEYIDFCTRHGLDSGLTREQPSTSSGQPPAGSRSVGTVASLPPSSPPLSCRPGSVPLHRQPSVPCAVDPPARPGHVDTTPPPATGTSRGPPRTSGPEGGTSSFEPPSTCFSSRETYATG